MGRETCKSDLLWNRVYAKRAFPFILHVKICLYIAGSLMEAAAAVSQMCTAVEQLTHLQRRYHASCST